MGCRPVMLSCEFLLLTQKLENEIIIGLTSRMIPLLLAIN